MSELSPFFQWIVIIGLVFILIMIGMLFILPTEEKKKKKRRQEEQVKQKDWENTALRLEKHVDTLKTKIDAFEKKEKALEKDLLVEQTKNKKMQEKLEQQRGWQEKEDTDAQRKVGELDKLKQNLKTLQEQSSNEHGKILRLEKSLKETDQKYDESLDLRRKVEAEAAQSKNAIQELRTDNAKLRAENIQMKKQLENVDWISKVEYDKIDEKLKQTEKELERFNRNNES